MTRDPASFRDPSGFVFSRDGLVHRQVNASFADEYDALMASGLYADLTARGLLVTHEEVPLRIEGAPPAHRVLRPEPVPFVSYPYEWCFTQLRDAARLTLEVQQRALARGMILRDASAYNIQFVGCRPVFIDTLSFARAPAGSTWTAYRHFCEHFLVPLALMAYCDPSLGRLARVHVDGIPVALGSRLLPAFTRMRPGLLTHVHLHASAVRRAARQAAALASSRADRSSETFGRRARAALADSLQRTVDRIRWVPSRTAWSEYYAATNYSDRAEASKRETVTRFVATVKARTPIRCTWDLGANVGRYSDVAAAARSYVVALDADHSAVDQHYREHAGRGTRSILPLVQDLTNPSGGVGWRGRERRSLAERGPADLILALALVHHLAIGANVPLDDVAEYLAQLGRWAIVEFVPKIDSQVQRLFRNRVDVFDRYTTDGFEHALGTHFTQVAREPVTDSHRTLYLFERRNGPPDSR